jgi:hypothetical protein
MTRRRRRRSQNTGVLILIAIVLVLWHLGVIPGLPPISSLAEPLKQLGTLVPPVSQLATLQVPTPAGRATPSGVLALAERTKTSGCTPSNGLPDAACTPGAIFADVAAGQVCTPGYSTQARNVPQSVKDDVYAAYGIASHEPGQYEVDHLIPLQLGGSNDIANLWPEAGDPRPGFHEKDRVEDYLHEQVCSGSLPLQEAQAQIAHDWYAVYQSMPK